MMSVSGGAKNQRRNVFMVVKVTKDEHEKFVRRAQSKGLTLSAYVRMLAHADLGLKITTK